MILSSLGFLNLKLVDILDIVAVALIIYFLFTKIRKTSAMYIFVAIVILLLIRAAAWTLNMKMLSTILGTVLDVGAVALIVIFQPEIRRFLSRIGRGTGFGEKNYLSKLLGRKDGILGQDDLNELCDACVDMAASKTGALIVILHRDPLTDIIDTGDTIDAEIKSRLIQNIFFKNSPLHDGALIINRGRIQAARCTLPISERADIPARYGMRHKAAVGVSEVSDAGVVVVSEQTGKISFVKGGEITPVTGKNHLKLLLGGEGEN